MSRSRMPRPGHDRGRSADLGNYTDNGNTVDATAANVELQGNASVTGSGTSFGDVDLNGGYFEISEMHVDGDLTIENAARINGARSRSPAM